MTDELEKTRENYQRVTKQKINQKILINHNVKKIAEIKKEIEWIKNPRPVSEINSQNATNTYLNTMPSSTGKKEIKTNSDQNSKKISDKETTLNKINEETRVNNNLIQDINKDIEKYKKINEKVENEIKDLNNELSNKFTLIFQLEMKIEKIKQKKKKKSEKKEKHEEEKKINV